MNQEDNQAANKEASEEDSLMEFPCSFSIKAMGIAVDDFDSLIVEIVRKH